MWSLDDSMQGLPSQTVSDLYLQNRIDGAPHINRSLLVIGSLGSLGILLGKSSAHQYAVSRFGTSIKKSSTSGVDKNLLCHFYPTSRLRQLTLVEHFARAANPGFINVNPRSAARRHVRIPWVRAEVGCVS